MDNFLASPNNYLDTIRMSLLMQILELSDQSQIDELKKLVYEYGSSLKESDLLGRQIFVWMALILRDF